MRINIKYIILMLLVLMIGFIGFVIIKSSELHKDNSEDLEINIGNETTYSEYEYYGPNSYTSWELGYEVAKKNSDWSRLPLSDEFKIKYNEKNGILGDLDFDKIELTPYDNDEMYNDKYYFVNRNNYFVISKGKEKTAYVYNLQYDGNLLKDVIIKDIYNITDKYGNDLNITGHVITKDTFDDSMYYLSRGGNDERSIAVTDRFHNKYPYFLDLFEHYSPLGANTISFDSTKSSWENKEAYFIVDSRLECKKREYIVNFTLDVKGYLDDAVAKCINIEKYERTSLNYPYDNVLYKNSDWTNLKMTDKFKSKYNSKDGCLPNIDNIDVTTGLIGGDVIDLYTMIYGYILKNGSYMWYCVRFINDENGYLDDIEFIPIDYNGIDAKEAKEIYLKEH